MKLIVLLLIIFFILLIGISFMDFITKRKSPYPFSPFSNAWGVGVCEGMEDNSGNSTTSATSSTSSASSYEDYSPNDSLILSQQNAGNIEYIKGRLDNLDNSSGKVIQHIFDISNNLTQLNDQVSTITEQQAQYALATAPSTVPAMDLSMPNDTTDANNPTSTSTSTSTSTTYT
jgi:hypothetical protein